jgi:hypothetical protein
MKDEERKVTELNNAVDTEEMEIRTVELELEDGTIEECEVLDVIEVEGKSYVALLPLDKDEYYVYGVVEDGDEVEILNIENEEEYEKAVRAFEEYFDDDDFEDDDDDDDDDEYYEDEDEDEEE